MTGLDADINKMHDKYDTCTTDIKETTKNITIAETLITTLSTKLAKKS